jgi:tryptophan halogenase
MPELTVLGAGTAGLLAAGHFHYWTPWDIEIIHDPDTPAAAVGEGSTPNVPAAMCSKFGFTLGDLGAIDARLKLGIDYDGWNERRFTHWFYDSMHALHFDAGLLQAWMLKRLGRSSRITISERFVADADEIDSPYVMDCRGTPPSMDGYEALSIPVNAALVADFPPEDRDTTLTKTMRHGWLFAIPLQSRTSYGYVHNDRFATEDEIVAEMEAELGTPVLDYRVHRFSNYKRIDNFGERLAYNGNRSFFLEPMEATSLGNAELIQRYAYDYWCLDQSREQVQHRYDETINGTVALINLHYAFGSKFNTPFWDYAVDMGQRVMAALPESKIKHFESLIERDGITDIGQNPRREGWFGTWGDGSVLQHIAGLGITHEHLDGWGLSTRPLPERVEVPK